MDGLIAQHALEGNQLIRPQICTAFEEHPSLQCPLGRINIAEKKVCLQFNVMHNFVRARHI